jgi:hypothetical protein
MLIKVAPSKGSLPLTQLRFFFWEEGGEFFCEGGGALTHLI